VTKKEIVRTISEELGMTQLKTKEIVQKTFQAIINTLVEDPDHRIELRNFGVFEVKRRKARKARNPRTGDKVDVPEKFVVTFKPGKEMEEKVRELERREADARKAAASSAAAAASRGDASPSPASAATAAPAMAAKTLPGGSGAGDSGYGTAENGSSSAPSTAEMK
jgi:integration host factor subunit beta